MATVKHPAFDNVTQTVDDPGPWVAQGWVELSDKEAAQVQHEQDPTAPLKPAGNATREEWLAYASAQPGADAGQLETLSRDELREQYK